MFVLVAVLHHVLYRFFCMHRMFILMNFQQAKLLLPPLGCPWALAFSSARQQGRSLAGWAGRTGRQDHGDPNTQKMQQCWGMQVGGAGMSIPLTKGRLLPDQVGWGLGVPRLRQEGARVGPEPAPTICSHQPLPPPKRGASVSDIWGGGVVDIRCLPSRINRNSLSRPA